jgi:MFS family permease
MGSKLLGFIVSTVIIFAMTFLFLPIGYSMMVQWFGGVFPGLIVILTEVYVFLGPYTDLLHLSIIIGASLIGGLIAGSWKGGIVVVLGTGVLGVILLIAFGVISFAGVFTDPALQAQLSALVTTPPPGVDLVTIITAPVIGELVDSLLTFILGGFGGGFDLSSILGLVLQPIILAFVINTILAFVFGAIGGLAGGIILPKKEKTYLPEREKGKSEEKDSLMPEYKSDEGVSL